MNEDDSIGDLVQNWREASKKKFKSERIRRLVFDSKTGKKPSEYNPEDYIPRIRMFEFEFELNFVINSIC